MENNQFYDTNDLIQNFPGLFDKENYQQSEIYGPTQLEIIGNGWTSIIENLCQQPTSISKNEGIGIKITLIKEKWGALRIHWHINNSNSNQNSKELVDQVVRKAINQSASSCWECGNPSQCECECECLDDHSPESCKYWNKSGWEGYFLPWCRNHWE